MDHTSTRGATGRPSGAGGSGSLALACAALVAIGLVFAFVMAAWHGDVGKGLAASGESLAGAVAHEVDRNIELLDRSIQTVADHWASAEVRSLPTHLRDMVLFGDVPQAPGFGAVLVIDRDGHVAAASPGTPRGAHPSPTATTSASTWPPQGWASSSASRSSAAFRGAGGWL